ncbi:tetratricopeptide repeat protein [uncultured Sneathiella sp.]|uniref:tetratricopeptide repeat protein n=1 Tax=uncultured Sneathiella sp. TaxID=879315 RepID=UPI0030D7013A|tara:strand:+ start:1492 stop:2979 length:1488 start_codon:yes stop_codon:yes gene_type:complete
MKSALSLTLVAFLMSGCVTTMKGTYAPTQDMNVTWFGLDADKVGIGQVTTDSDLDGHFQIELELLANEELQSIDVFQTDASGTFHLGMGVWSTRSTAQLNWIVGVFKDGKQINTTHTPSLGSFSGHAVFDIYIAQNNFFNHLRNGNHFVIEVTHGGKTSRQLITLRQNASVSRKLSKPMTEAEKNAIAQQEEMRAAKFRQLSAAYDEAMQQGEKFEKSGGFREAAKSYQEAVSSAVNMNDPSKQNEARKKAIAAVRSLSVPPAIPEEARRHAIRGETIMTGADSIADFKRAAREFEDASVLAPWWGSIYYNLGLAHEASKNAQGALAAFKLFLVAEPNAPEAPVIRERTYALEVAAEEQAAVNGMVGEWQTTTGSLVKSALNNNQFTVTAVKVSDEAKTSGYYDGQIYFEGLLTGNEAVGRSAYTHDYKALGAHQNFTNCFGDFGKYNATAKLTGPDELTIEVNDRVVSLFNTSTCETLDTSPLSFKTVYTRVGE